MYRAVKRSWKFPNLKWKDVVASPFMAAPQSFQRAYTSSSETVREYDFVIVGGGSAGL